MKHVENEEMNKIFLNIHLTSNFWQSSKIESVGVIYGVNFNTYPIEQEVHFHSTSDVKV